MTSSIAAPAVPATANPSPVDLVAPTDGAIVRERDLLFVPEGDYLRAAVVSPHIGAHLVRLDVLEIPAGRAWDVARSDLEQILLVALGTATATIGGAQRRMPRASAVYCPTGASACLRADRSGPVRVYRWRHRLAAGSPVSARPHKFGYLFDDTTQLRGFAGTGQVDATDKRATMNFLFWPGSGSAALCLHCGIQQPGETFSVHLHRQSEDAFVAFEGSGQMYLRDRWHDVNEGDILFAPPMVLHGARNPHTGPGARRFVTCGGPTPFDTFLYDAAGLSSEVV
jgi:mannose-6-phosphate isomerase-like protein (cupin superfamily)